MTEPSYPHTSCGAFCVYHGIDPDTQEPAILLIERGERFKGGPTEGHGMPGGYIELDDREQPAEGAVRELGEEIIDPDGEPVLTTITPDRLQPVKSGIDYNMGKPGTLNAGVHWDGHKCALSAAEVATLKNYIMKLNSDPDYEAAVKAASNQELGAVIFADAADLADDIENNRIRFAYDHERTVALTVARQLTAAPPKPGLTSKFEC